MKDPLFRDGPIFCARPLTRLLKEHSLCFVTCSETKAAFETLYSTAVQQAQKEETIEAVAAIWSATEEVGHKVLIKDSVRNCDCIHHQEIAEIRKAIHENFELHS